MMKARTKNEVKKLFMDAGYPDVRYSGKQRAMYVHGISSNAMTTILSKIAIGTFQIHAKVQG